jgi:hypothetical protein
MKKQAIIISIFIFCISFLGCEDMAILFHGPRPEDPPVTYSVTFDGNGASGTAPVKQTVNADTMISLPGKGGLDKAGDIFAGWNESSSGTGTTYAAGASVTVIGNTIFYAQWLDSSTPQYTVAFNANGATGGAPPASQTVYSGISITLPSRGTLAYSGKTFGGWNTQINGGGTNYPAGTAYTVTGNVTLYAKWQSEIQYTVTYNANGANGTAPAAQTVDPGTVITLPGAGNMTNVGKTFDSWNTSANGTGTGYAEESAYTVNGNASLYAQWVSVPITPPGATLVEQLAYIRNNAGDGVVYDIVVNNDEYIGPQTVSTMGRNITVNIHSASSSDPKTIQLEGNGYLFSVDTGLILKLQDMVLRGHSMNNRALVAVGQGTLILNSGAKITGNTNAGTAYLGASPRGGGIYVGGGVLELNEGSEITENIASENSAAYGGGIYVENSSSVIIRGGIISGNTVGNSSDASQGGGIYITGNSTVTMSGGIISNNVANGRYATGGGIYIVNGSSFTKRAVLGSSTSGIIYGGSGDSANLTTYTGVTNNGNAIYRNFGTLKQRNTTLGADNEISTGNDVGWE